MKEKIKKTLAFFGILYWTYKLREYLKSFITKKEKIYHNEILIPPPYLRMLVVGNTNATKFIKEGKERADQILRCLADNKIEIRCQSSVLDFGCGCGRLIRHFHGLNNSLNGCDYNKKLIRWCQKNLTFARFKTNSLPPPLPYSDEEHSFIYAISVFTHLSEPLQHLWFSEIDRILCKDGHFLFTFHGTSYLDKMSQEEIKEFRDNQLVVRNIKSSGSNMCAVFHPFDWIKYNLPINFKIIDHIADSEKIPQDMILVKKI